MNTWTIVYRTSILSEDLDKYLLAYISYFKDFLWFYDNSWDFVKILCKRVSNRFQLDLCYDVSTKKDSLNPSLKLLKESYSHTHNYVCTFTRALDFSEYIKDPFGLIIQDKNFVKKYKMTFDIGFHHHSYDIGIYSFQELKV